MEKKRLNEQAKAEVERLRRQTEAELARLNGQSFVLLRRFSAERTVAFAEEKLRKSIDDRVDAQLVKGSIAEIGGLS